MKMRLLILFISVSLFANSQYAHPYKVYSENGEYFIKSIPFYGQVWTEDGKTIICKTNDTAQIITTVNRYFQPDFLFLSNDGKSFCFILNWFNSGCEWRNDIIFFYSNGVLVKKYKGTEFVDSTTNTRIEALCYKNQAIDSLVESNGMLIKSGFKKGTDSLSAYYNTNNSFLKNDTLYLLTHNKFVNRFSIKTGDLIDKTSFEDYSKTKLIHPNKRIIQNYKIKMPIGYGLPKLANDEDYCIALAKTAKLVYCNGTNADYEHKYKKNAFEIFCGIDSLGNCVDVQIDCKDSVLRNATVAFLKKSKFKKEEIPQGIDTWYFMHTAFFRNESKRIAKRERKLEIIEEKRQYQIRISSDSIKGIYIPKDITDCFTSLNIILKTENINEFKNKTSNEVIGNYHFGLGLWMRNNWGLWGGSRLSLYFNKLGIKHPDDMSGIILTSYHRYLNNQDLDLNVQISYYMKYWENAKKNRPKVKKAIKFTPPEIRKDK